jgi:hypothetical protein
MAVIRPAILTGSSSFPETRLLARSVFFQLLYRFPRGMGLAVAVRVGIDAPGTEPLQGLFSLLVDVVQSRWHISDLLD